MYTFFYILKNSFKKNYFSILFKKILKRFEKNTSIEAKKWAISNVKITTQDYLKHLDYKLFNETAIAVKEIENDAEKKLSTIDFSLGGAGNYMLLYFLIRKFKPKIIVETGVAAGWSSLSILRALHRNGNGKLYSSDFPYFRLKNPENYVGFLAKKEINYKDWFLDIRGDEIALQNISSMIPDSSVNIFHYDSDKSYSGRLKAYNIIKRKLSEDAIIIYDDIQNNFHFKDLVNNLKVNYHIFEFKGKYLGVIGI